jgi:RNA polymerase sigma-70 factor, ECF subfamily
MQTYLVLLHEGTAIRPAMSPEPAPGFRRGGSPAFTDWWFIVHLYQQLFAINPSPVVALNRAVAISRWQGPAAGLEALAAIEHHASLANYHLLPATQARLYEELGDAPRAAAFYQRALECDCGPAERRFLLYRICEKGSGVTR